MRGEERKLFQESEKGEETISTCRLARLPEDRLAHTSLTRGREELGEESTMSIQ